MRERTRRGRGDRYRGVSGGSRGLQGSRRRYQGGKGVAIMCRGHAGGVRDGREPPGGQEARAEIAEGSVVGTTKPVGGGKRC